MERNTLIVLVTVLIVVTVLGTCIGLVGYSSWEDMRLQQGEIMHNPEGVEITYTGLAYAPLEINGECLIVANVTNTYPFDLAWVGIRANFTDYGEEGSVWNAIHHLKSNETKEMVWYLPGFCKSEECNEERYKDFKPVEITAYKYKNEG